MVDQALFPVQCGRDDEIEIVETGLPAENRLDAFTAGDQARRVAGPARALFDWQWPAMRFFYRREYLPHAVTPAVAGIEHYRIVAGSQVAQRI